MHVRSKEKPRGLIVGTIDDPEKSGIADAVVVRIAIALRDTSQIATLLAVIMDDCWLPLTG